MRLLQVEVRNSIFIPPDNPNPANTEASHQGSGLSRATCLAFAKSGAQGVLVVDINLETAQQTATDCIAVATSPVFRAEAIQCDVTQEESVKSAMAHMIKTFGRVDYCVNGAGVS